MPGRILIVDDEIELCRLLQADLGRRDYEVTVCTMPGEALELLAANGYDAVVLDLHLGGTSGLDLCRRIAQERPDLPVIIITAFGNMEAAIGAIRAGAYDFVTKPFEVEALQVSLDRAIGHHRLSLEVQRLRRAVDDSHRFQQMLGASRPMQELFDLITRVADSEASVLITGESGTGKECVARAVHAASRRQDGPFLAVNCAAIPESLLESELFGHTRGAFTDARQERTGLFVGANGGTLFLDEISELPLAMQPKLLRALQERTVRPLGSSQEIPFDVRLLAATNRDLEEEVRARRFREDLFFRVQVVHIEVPPLRIRGNDILLLAQEFLETFAARANKPVKGVSQAVASKLLDFSWPGNVRELQNCMERAVALTLRTEVSVEDLPARVREFRGPGPEASGAASPLPTMEEVERRHILAVLESAAGNKAVAARILNLDRKTLYRKLEAYGVISKGSGEPDR